MCDANRDAVRQQPVPNRDTRGRRLSERVVVAEEVAQPEPVRGGRRARGRLAPAAQDAPADQERRTHKSPAMPKPDPASKSSPAARATSPYCSSATAIGRNGARRVPASSTTCARVNRRRTRPRSRVRGRRPRGRTVATTGRRSCRSRATARRRARCRSGRGAHQVERLRLVGIGLVAARTSHSHELVAFADPVDGEVAAGRKVDERGRERRRRHPATIDEQVRDSRRLRAEVHCLGACLGEPGHRRPGDNREQHEPAASTAPATISHGIASVYFSATAPTTGTSVTHEATVGQGAELAEVPRRTRTTKGWRPSQTERGVPECYPRWALTVS